LPFTAVGNFTFAGSITANNTITLKIGCTGGPPACTVATASYTHTVATADTLTSIIQDFVNKINTTDTNVTAQFNSTANTIVVTAKFPGAPGGNVTISATQSTNATILANSSGTTLNIYLENPAQVAPGTLVQIVGNNLCDSVGAADFSQTYLPTSMNNCTLYVDGIRAPLLYVSPTQVNAQVPLEFFRPHQHQSLCEDCARERQRLRFDADRHHDRAAEPGTFCFRGHGSPPRHCVSRVVRGLRHH